VIKVKDLVKRYGNLTAVDGISFEVQKGELFGLLGENGAGKTTTLEIFEGLRRADSGRVTILGRDINKGISHIKERIGVQLQSSAYYHFLNLTEILELFGSFYNKRLAPKELLAMVNLQDKAKSYINNLSGGQQQRFSIVASLINDPDIIFLDEPTTGLDPLARRNLWDLIAKIKKRGKTIILTTHYMEEAERLADRVAIMEQGRILTMGPIFQLVRQVRYPYRINFVDSNISEESLKRLSRYGLVGKDNSKEDSYQIKARRQSDVNRALEILQRSKPKSLTLHRASLEDLFIKLTGKKIE